MINKTHIKNIHKKAKLCGNKHFFRFHSLSLFTLAVLLLWIVLYCYSGSEQARRVFLWQCDSGLEWLAGAHRGDKIFSGTQFRREPPIARAFEKQGPRFCSRSFVEHFPRRYRSILAVVVYTHGCEFKVGPGGGQHRFRMGAGVGPSLDDEIHAGTRVAGKP